MLKFLGLMVAGVLTLGVAIQAQAEPLSMTGSLSLQIGGLPPAAIPGGGVIFVSSGHGGFTEVAGIFGPTTLPLPVSLFTGMPQISGLTLAAFGNFSKIVSCSGPGVCTATGGLAGDAFVNILQLFNLSIPLSVVGQSGAATQNVVGNIVITVIGQGWTAGTATVTGVTTTTPGTAVVSTASSQGSDNRTANHAGTLVLVSGFQVITNVAGKLPGFAFQALTFVPEAGTLLLLGRRTT